MKFKQHQLVHLKESILVGRVAGFCHYTPFYTSEGAVAPDGPPLEGVIVNLCSGFYHPKQQAFITMMICQEDTLEAW